MRKKSSIEQQPVMLAPTAPAQPTLSDAWRYAEKPPIGHTIDGEVVTSTAEDWRRDPKTSPWMIIRCCLCDNAMATKNLKHDACEDCGFRVRDDFHEAQRAVIHRAENRLVNPFRSVDEFHEMGGSLPSVSGPKR